jgi:hypothetical protein
MASLSISAPSASPALSVGGLATPPASPTGTEAGGSPSFLFARPQRCGPTGADPFTEQRAEARRKAQEGAICPVNQHGCMYFSASEWRFCTMCEWEVGHGMGEHNGTLMFMGGRAELYAKDIVEQNAVLITRAGLDDLFRAPGTKSWTGLIQTWDWEKFKPAEDGKVLLNRDQLHNLLMKYGSPSGCLTDELWASLKKAWPCP